MEHELLLTPFAPALQFWAGICLLFTYDAVLKKSPFAEKLNSARDDWGNFLNSNQGVVSEELYKKGCEKKCITKLE